MRWLTGLLSLLLFAAFAASCDNDEPTVQDEQQPQAAQTQPVAVEEEAQQVRPQTQRAEERPEIRSEQAQTDERAGTAQGVEESPSDPVEADTPTYRGGEFTPDDYDPEFALQVIDHLTNRIGPRVAGSGTDLVAAEYLAETFRSLGYEAKLEAFTYTPGAIVASLRIDGAILASALLMQGAGQRPAQGTLINVPGIGSADDFASVNVAGSVAIVNRGTLFFADKAENAIAAGAIGLIVVNTDDSPLVGTIEPAVDVPVVGVSEWEGRLLRDRAGEVVEITTGDATQASVNVVARKSDGECRIVVGGHYDTVPSVDGANDNASGTAVTVALARAWQDADSARYVCFVGFGAEELGLHGSRAFVAVLRQHGRLDQVEAMLNLDAIGDGNPPLTLVGTAGLQDQALYLAGQIDIQARPGSLPMTVGSDHQPFASAGIDVIFPLYHGAALHVPGDNFANLNRRLTAEAGQLSHAILACLLLDIGAVIKPAVSCSEQHAREAPPTINYASAAAAAIDLAETLGPRPAGTPEEAAAAEHIAAVLRAYGYEAQLEPFDYWVEYPYAQIFLSDSEDTPVSRFANSEQQAVEGRLLPLEGTGAVEDYEGLNAVGAVVIVDRGGLTFGEKAQYAVEAGAAALIIVNNDNTWLVGDLAGYRSQIPVLGIPRQQGRNLADRAPQIVEISPSPGEDGHSQNVVAKRAGATCRVIVGAHYDTVYKTAGYNDNSSGTALMMQFARIYADHAAADHLCFLGFGAEEVGIYGSREYVERLEESGQLADVRYLLNLDAIASGRRHLYFAVQGADLPLLAMRLANQLGTEFLPIVKEGWADAYPFAQAGVATFFPLPASGVMNTIADDASNFDVEVFEQVARISEHMLQCMLELAGAEIDPLLDCHAAP